jgi:alkyl hydroperoxide reductase subunit AhpC
MPAFEADKAKFAELDAQVVGISVDSIPSHIAWQEQAIGKLSYPLCADFYPHGRVAKLYGVLREGPPLPGISNRCVVIIDKAGKVAWKKVYDLAQAPDNEEILLALRGMAGLS